MDPLSAIGIAASIAQFVSLGVKVVARLKEYSSATTDVPKSLQRISSQLPLLLSALERIKTDAEVEKVDINTRCLLKGVVAGCMLQVEKIDRIIDKVLYVPGASLVIKVQKVFASIKNDEKVLAIEKNIQTYISILILHQVIEGPDLSLAANEDTLYFEVRVKKVSPFLDRVELQEIEAHLHPVVTSQLLEPIFIALVGQEAAGKTQLALEYCHQTNAVGHFQTIFWLNAATPQNLSRSLESACDIIRRSKDGLKNRSEKIDFLKSFLCKRWHPWLLILDNYNPTEFNNIKEFLPSQGSGAILLTTRYKEIPASTRLIRVPKFRKPEELDQLRQSLLRAVRDNDVGRIKVLLENGADPNCRDDASGWPCLQYAIDEENEAAVKLLLARGARSRVHSSVKSGVEGYATALYRAASIGNTSITRILLDEEDAAGLSPPAPGNNAVFRVAAEKGHKDVVRMLIEHNSVDLAGMSEYKETALGLACQNGHTSVVEILLDHQADVETDSGAAPPLTWAVKNNQLDTVKMLCKKGKANLNAGNLTYPTDQQPPLWHATCAARDSDDLVKYLLESGADPNRSGKTQTSPLQEAVRRELESVISVLLSYGADPYPSQYYRDPPICIAALYGCERIMTLLLQTKTLNSALRAQQQEKALILASVEGKRNMILVLINAGTNINAIGDDGKTPLLFSIENNQTPTARLLLRQGARCDIPDEDGDYPLHLAAGNGLDLVVKDILRSSKNPNLRNRNGDIPLCLAAAQGNEKVVRVLLEQGADPNLVNKFGDTAVDLAMEGDYESIVKILKSTNAWLCEGQVEIPARTEQSRKESRS